MIDVETLRAAGLSQAQIDAVVAEAAARERELIRQRSRRYRQNKNPKQINARVTQKA